MGTATTTATTLTAQVSSTPNVQYEIGEPSGQVYSVTPHEPTPR